MGASDQASAGAPGGCVPAHQGTGPEADRAIARDIEAVGAACRPGVIPDDRVAELRDFVDRALEADDAWHAPGDRENAGRVTFLPRYGALPLTLLDDDGVMGPVAEAIGPDSQIYTITTLCQGPGATGRPVHLDLPYQPPGYLLGVGVMVLLDDFTEASGPTRIYPEIPEAAPSDEDFEARAMQLLAPAGSVCWMNAGAWHDVLPNRDGRWRRSILLAMGRPWVRQRFDLARMLSHLDVEALPERVQRHLGLLTLPPGSYEEYYLPAEGRREAILRAALDRC